MFAPAFAPFANPEAIVNSKLVLAFLEAGWEVDVISRNLAEKSTYNYGSGWVDPWLPLRKIMHVTDYNVGGRLRRFAGGLWGGLRMGYFITGCRWATHAYDIGLRLHREKQYDLIMSRALPSSAHLPAKKLSADTNMPWIANWNDPWEFLRKSVVKGNLKKNIGYFEAIFCEDVGKSASRHTFPSEKLRHKMCQYLGSKILERSSVVPHVALPTTSSLMPTDHKIFRIAFAGRLWKYQSPEIFLKSLASFIKKINGYNRVIFSFIGIDDNNIRDLAISYGIDSVIQYIGKQKYSETLGILSKCDVLLTIDPPDTDGVILTSKLVDYAQTGRPILALTTKFSTSDEIITNYGGGIAVDCHSSEAIIDALIELYSHWEKNTLDEKYGSYRLYNIFSPETVVDKYKKIFLQIGVRAS
jgi:glycosyltransferase involved in cell wall biosynthesis